MEFNCLSFTWSLTVSLSLLLSCWREKWWSNLSPLFWTWKLVWFHSGDEVPLLEIRLVRLLAGLGRTWTQQGLPMINWSSSCGEAGTRNHSQTRGCVLAFPRYKKQKFAWVHCEFEKKCLSNFLYSTNSLSYRSTNLRACYSNSSIHIHIHILSDTRADLPAWVGLTIIGYAQ
jgi:hypothetical protein